MISYCPKHKSYCAVCDICGKYIHFYDPFKRRLLVRLSNGKIVLKDIMFCRECSGPLDTALYIIKAEITTLYLRDRNPELLEKFETEEKNE